MGRRMHIKGMPEAGRKWGGSIARRTGDLLARKKKGDQVLDSQDSAHPATMDAGAPGIWCGWL